MLDRDRIEKLAPDQASLAAALKLLKPSNWPVLASGGKDALVWGECQGSGATPYRTVVSPVDFGYKCTCPSRKFPCKHVLSLMLFACEPTSRLATAPMPDWVEDWQARRRPKAAATAAAPARAEGAPAVSLAEAVAAAGRAEAEAPDPKAAARAEAQRQRLRQEREAAVLASLDDFDRWVVDQLGLGLAAFAQRAGQSVRTLSTRLVDHKAQGLATRLDMLAADVFRVPAPEREDFVVERLAALVLISAAYRRQDRLPPDLREDVRRAVGWTVRREDLLADPAAPRVASTWIVVATRSEVQPDNLRRLETWLLDTETGTGAPRLALMIDFVPVSAGASASPFFVDEVLAGEVVFYPSATPLRGLVAERRPGPPTAAWPPLPEGFGPGLAAAEAALARHPWLDERPITAAGVAVVRLADGRHGLADRAGIVLPLAPQQAARALPLAGLADIAVILTWDGRLATLLAADTSIGRWSGG